MRLRGLQGPPKDPRVGEGKRVPCQQVAVHQHRSARANAHHGVPEGGGVPRERVHHGVRGQGRAPQAGPLAGAGRLPHDAGGHQGRRRGRAHPRPALAAQEELPLVKGRLPPGRQIRPTRGPPVAEGQERAQRGWGRVPVAGARHLPRGRQGGPRAFDPVGRLARLPAGRRGRLHRQHHGQARAPLRAQVGAAFAGREGRRLHLFRGVPGRERGACRVAAETHGGDRLRRHGLEHPRLQECCGWGPPQGAQVPQERRAHTPVPLERGNTQSSLLRGTLHVLQLGQGERLPNEMTHIDSHQV
mmetsp:Transcript_30990/g.66604  ORF Transcript_30990/g.66604 Transcript_30990/m.66604 type:complete len:301 (+) Transcript_30990:564-1466(+)